MERGCSSVRVDRVWEATRQLPWSSETDGVGEKVLMAGVRNVVAAQAQPLERRPSDTAVGRQEVLIHLRLHRFRRGNGTCAGRTSDKQVPRPGDQLRPPQQRGRRGIASDHAGHRGALRGGAGCTAWQRVSTTS